MPAHGGRCRRSKAGTTTLRGQRTTQTLPLPLRHSRCPRRQRLAVLASLPLSIVELSAVALILCRNLRRLTRAVGSPTLPPSTRRALVATRSHHAPSSQPGLPRARDHRLVDRADCGSGSGRTPSIRGASCAERNDDAHHGAGRRACCSSRRNSQCAGGVWPLPVVHGRYRVCDCRASDYQAGHDHGGREGHDGCRHDVWANRAAARLHRLPSRHAVRQGLGVLPARVRAAPRTPNPGPGPRTGSQHASPSRQLRRIASM